MSIKRNNAIVVSTCNQRLTALKSNVKAKAAVTVNGESVSPATLTATYQACLDTRAALAKQRAVYQAALEARDAADSARVTTDKGLRAWVATTFGANSNTAKEFGFGPVSVGEKSVADKADAVAKAKATRIARMTMGKRQKVLTSFDEHFSPAFSTVELRAVA